MFGLQGGEIGTWRHWYVFVPKGGTGNLEEETGRGREWVCQEHIDMSVISHRVKYVIIQFKVLYAYKNKIIYIAYR